MPGTGGSAHDGLMTVRTGARIELQVLPALASPRARRGTDRLERVADVPRPG